jgi:predicted flap endonuclease-1-like 5' DNA nuclease
MKLHQIENIGINHVKKLEEAGIRTPQRLLEKGQTPEQRRELAQETGIDEQLILEWVRFADLLRLEGIGIEYASLLEEVGVDTSRELAARDVQNLVTAMRHVNEEKNLVRRLPSLRQLTKAIQSAIAINQSPRGLAGNGTTDAPPPKKDYGPRLEY